MTNKITLAYLQSLWKDMTGVTQMQLSIGDPDSQTNWYSYNRGTTEITIEIDGINFVPSGEGNHFINYVIECHEVL